MAFFWRLMFADSIGKIFRLILAFDNQWQSTQCIQYIFLFFKVYKHLSESLEDIRLINTTSTKKQENKTKKQKSFHFHPYHQCWFIFRNKLNFRLVATNKRGKKIVTASAFAFMIWKYILRKHMCYCATDKKRNIV